MSQSPCTVVCPAHGYADVEVERIRARGNLPLLIGAGGEVLAEIDRLDLAESWATATRMSPIKVAALSRRAGERLAEILDQNLASADLAELVTDAAVLFLTAVRAAGATDPAAYGPCAVHYTGETGQEPTLVPA